MTDLSFLDQPFWQDNPNILPEPVHITVGSIDHYVSSRGVLYRMLSEGAQIVQDVVEPQVTPAIQEVQASGQTEQGNASRQAAQGKQTEASQPATTQESEQVDNGIQ